MHFVLIKAPFGKKYVPLGLLLLKLWHSFLLIFIRAKLLSCQQLKKINPCHLSHANCCFLFYFFGGYILNNFIIILVIARVELSLCMLMLREQHELFLVPTRGGKKWQTSQCVAILSCCCSNLSPQCSILVSDHVLNY